MSEPEKEPLKLYLTELIIHEDESGMRHYKCPNCDQMMLRIRSMRYRCKCGMEWEVQV